MQRYYITLGAPTTANGKVISANHLDTINDDAIALVGDKCWCPKCNSEGLIVLDGPRLSETFDDREVALSDDLCMCKCNPPPRLVAAQDFAYQMIDTDWHAAQTEEAVASAAKLNTAATGAAAKPDRAPLVLLDPRTDEPYRYRPYKLQLAYSVIEGKTDQYGATRPLTAAERAAIVEWHVDGENAPA